MAQRLIFALRRRTDMDRAEFQRYWLKTHAPLVREHAAELAIVRYQQIHTVLDDATYGGQPFDGVAELWFAGLPGAHSGEASRALLADERRFIDHAESPIALATEHVVIGGPETGMRMTTLLYRSADLDTDGFRRHWSEVHAPIALVHAATLGSQRYVQLHDPTATAGFPPAAERGAPLAPDGIGESYFEPDRIDPERFDAAMHELQQDALRFIDPARTVSAIGRVERIIG